MGSWRPRKRREGSGPREVGGAKRVGQANINRPSDECREKSESHTPTGGEAAHLSNDCLRRTHGGDMTRKHTNPNIEPDDAEKSRRFEDAAPAHEDDEGGKKRERAFKATAPSKEIQSPAAARRAGRNSS